MTSKVIIMTLHDSVSTLQTLSRLSYSFFTNHPTLPQTAHNRFSRLLCLLFLTLFVDLIFPARYSLGSHPRANSSFPSAPAFSDTRSKRVPLSLSLHLLCFTFLHYCRELYDYQSKYFVFLSLSFNFYKAEIITASLTAVIKWYHTCQST